MDPSDDVIGNPPFSPLWLERDVAENDFDGHTAFHSMTFTQKLTWVSEAVVSFYMLAKENPRADCNLLFERCRDR